MYGRDAPPPSGKRESSAFWQRLWPFSKRGGPNSGVIVKLYRQIVTQARNPVFYEDRQLADTADNRREMLGCVAALAMIRLHRCGPWGEKQAQALFDYTFADVEQNFREQGVSDVSIGKHVKKAAATFLARYRMIESCIDNDRTEDLGQTLAKNMAFAHDPAQGGEAIARDLMALFNDLAQQGDDSVLSGDLAWSGPGPDG